MGFFSIDSGFMKLLGRIADLMILGFWSILCCIPIFTIGTSISATYYVTLKMVRNEDCYVTKDFFKAFRANFKKATIVWVIVMVLVGIFYVNFQLMNSMDMKFEVSIRSITLAIIGTGLFLGGYLFPLLAWYENAIKKTIKNSMIISICNIPRSLVILLVNASPFLVFNYFPKAFPFILLFSISVVCYLNSHLIRGIFDQYKLAAEQREKESLEESNQDEVVESAEESTEERTKEKE